jgi:nitronate monooxygenase
MRALVSLPRNAPPRPETMEREDYGRLLNVLLEAERAGAKLLAAYGDELPSDADAWAWLRAIQRDEARNCSVLIHLLLEEGVEPSTAVGDFYRRGLAIRGWDERLRFLNRGQRWVARTIAEALPRLSSFVGKKPLQAMYDSHFVNIGICEQHLKL